MKQIIFIYLIGVAMTVAAQKEAPAGEIEDAQIIIEKDKPLTLPKASRIYQRSVVKTLIADTVNLRFDLSKPVYALETSNYSPRIHSFESAGEESTTRNYLKAGFGNYLSPIVQGYAGYQGQDRSAGLYLFHESFAKGPVRDEQSAYGQSNVKLHASLLNKGLRVSPSLSYNREAFYFYGRPEEADSLFINDKINVTHVVLNVPLAYSPSESIAFKFEPQVAHTAMGYGGTSFNQELYLGLAALTTFSLGEQMDLDINLRYDHYQYESGAQQARDVAALNPALTYNNQHGLNLKLGLGIAFGADSLARKAYLYPDLNVGYQLNDELMVFLEAEGGVNPADLNDLKLRNRYLDDSLSLLNEITKVDLRVGIQYAIKPDLLIEPFVGYQLVTNKQFYYPSASDSSQFKVVYDGGDFIQTNLGLVVRYINNRSELVGRMILSSYQNDELDEAWYLPATTLDVSYNQVLTETLRINARFQVLQGLKAPAPVNGTIIDLPTIADLSIGANYDISKNISAFVSANNLFNSKYERYLNYPVRGIAAKIGFIYRF